MSRKNGLSPVKLRKLRLTDLMVKYYLEGNTMQGVVDKIKYEHKMNTSIQSVSKYIKQMVQVWKEESVSLIENHKITALQKIDKLELEYYEAWERSKQAIETITQKFEPGEGKTEAAKKRNEKLKETIKSFRANTGEAKFLEGIRWCTDKRFEILGGLAPILVEANHSGTITNNTTIRRVVFTSSKKEMTGVAQTTTTEEKPEDKE